MVKVRKDITGWIMSERGVPDSRLTVIRQVEDYITPAGNHYARWLCECSCLEHNKIIADGYSITSGATKSCGCLKREVTANFNKKIKKKQNEYSDLMHDEHGDYYIGYASNTHNPFYFDADDIEKVKSICWWERTDRTTHYLSGWNPDSEKCVSMHSYLGFSNHDHIDGNELNNRKYNLRPATKAENNFNRRNLKPRTLSYVGIYRTSNGKYNATLRYQDKCYYGKYRETEEEAFIDRLRLEAKYFGKFASHIDLFEQYGININDYQSID